MKTRKMLGLVLTLLMTLAAVVGLMPVEAFAEPSSIDTTPKITFTLQKDKSGGGVLQPIHEVVDPRIGNYTTYYYYKGPIYVQINVHGFVQSIASVSLSNNNLRTLLLV